MARRVLMAEVSRWRLRGSPRLGFMDGVKVVFDNRGMTVVATRKILKSRQPWCISNRMSFMRPFLLGPVFFWTALPCSGGYHLERGGMPLHEVRIIE